MVFLLFLLPVVVGLFLALFGSWICYILVQIGFRQVHPVPNAWDWKFRNVDDQWVLVTFTDGSQVAGHLGSESFLSSDPSERDIYIQRVFKVDSQTKNWKETGAKGILIAPGQVKTIEFWPYEHTCEELNSDFLTPWHDCCNAESLYTTESTSCLFQFLRKQTCIQSCFRPIYTCTQIRLSATIQITNATGHQAQSLGYNSRQQSFTGRFQRSKNPLPHLSGSISRSKTDMTDHNICTLRN